jgi:hypothetical protein
MVVIFSDGFEDPGYPPTPWTGIGTGGGNTETATSLWSHHGNKSGDFNMVSGDFNCDAYKIIAPQTVLFTRYYFKIISSTLGAGKNTAIIMYYDSVTGQDDRIFLINDARNLGLVYYSGGAYHTVTSATTLSLNTVYYLELKYVKSATVGEMRVYLNGSEVADLTQTGLNTAESPNVVVIGARCGFASSGIAMEMYIDCVVVADSYIGGEDVAVGGSIVQFVNAIVKR